MTMFYNVNNIFGLEGYGIINAFNIDTNGDVILDIFNMDENDDGILEGGMLLGEEEILNFDPTNMEGYDLVENPTYSINNCKEKKLQDNCGVTSLNDVGNFLEAYGIKVERLLSNCLTIYEKVAIGIDGDETWNDEDESDGGFFSSLFGYYDKNIVNELEVVGMDGSYPDIQWSF